MDRQLKPQLERLGAAVAEVSDAGKDEAVLVDARRRFLSSMGPLPTHSAPNPGGAGALRRRARPSRVFAALAAAACLVLAAAFLLRPRAPAVSFDVGDPPRRGDVGVWIAAEQTSAVPIRFSEGSTLKALPGARMRVTETTAHGAQVLLERGSVTASVTHTGSETRWGLRAGPFDVRITGTSFEASWDPASETFEIAMVEGSVLVGGPLLQTERAVLAGERLRISTREGRIDLGVLGPRAEPAIAQAPASACAPELTARPPASTAPAEASPPLAPGVHELLAAGKTREALEAAERDGFARELERASSGDLYALSDAARFASRPGEARDALLAMRRRFGARGRSAFLLGKIAADQLHSAGDAASWFETYLREDPGGALAEQALGRLVELRQRGAPGVARATAERYLSAYPHGSYAALAKSILGP